MRKLLVAIVAIAVLAVSPACKTSSKERAGVVVTIFPVYDLARRVAGPDADVTLLVPPTRVPKGYEPTAHDTDVVRSANLGVMVGLGLDPWMEPLMKGARPKARTLTVGDRVPSLASAADAPADEQDPYVWLDPERARLVVRAIAEELGRVDASHAVAYRERATAIDGELAALDKEVESRTKALASKPFVTLRPTFAYFAERYHLTVAATLDGDSQTKKATAAIAAGQVRAVFGEPPREGLDVSAAAKVAGGANARLGVLDPFGGTPETDSYEKLIRADVTSLEKALN